ncbi:hypothetical protein [Salegentibacter sediminis]|uniref:hypothetical protein n=1 Tax=Salegentibacter sediminis TaxID=1930251 RepID=UPI0009BF4A5E|nr:hypothetical protein [Salegentibacter sediminis]
MKTLIIWLMLIPFLGISQTENETQEPLIIATMLIAPEPADFFKFREGLKAHNNEYHAEGAMGVRIFQVMNGPNAEKMMAVMGPMPWSALDNATYDNREAHDKDWYENVVPYMKDEQDITYWRFDTGNSHFPQNFEMSKLDVTTYDFKAGTYEAAMDHVEKISAVFKNQYPETPLGIYTNEFAATKDGRDLSLVYFFDDFATLGVDHKWKEKYEKEHGQGSYESFYKGWMDLLNGAQTEIWIYDQELSGIGPQVTTRTQN